jgi:hypothetical protein
MFALVSVVETVLVFVLIPLAIYGVVALLTLRERPEKPARYRPGQPWDHPPVWWVANPAGVGAKHAAPEAAHNSARSSSKQTAKGGARGSW